ncbi:MAG: hypothetical protein HFG97_14720 [Dorea sp.]|nr:hypothetical protein [Dorea sp.]
MQGFKAGKYYADFAESCEAVNECKEGKAWRKYLPPGFRTGTAWKMILAVTGYLMVMSLSFSMEIKEQETPGCVILVNVCCQHTTKTE